MALFSGASIGDNYKELVKKRRSKVIKGNTYERQEAIQRVELDVSAQEKLLFSNKKHMNRAALMANYLDHRESRALPPDTPKASNHKRTKSNSPPRRETFKEDKLRINEQAHKRVLIQKGIYKRQIAPLYEPVSKKFST
ncbi:MAG: hypothetical protein JST59_02430 [Actinobacteria bacterium]|nr:hypothetical protein [Actinomycetota bacterium]